MTDKYFPESVTQANNLETLKLWLASEHRRLSTVINDLVDGHQNVSHKAPTRPREGDIRRADGSNWDPASAGPGFIWFTGDDWRYFYTKKVMLNAAGAPAGTDNGSLGYSVGSLWVNVSAGAAYMLCGLASANASANWVILT